ncbi:MAG: hypothetical protein LUD17_13645 [Bacteroidales bacterium]|nr:hypothetical protein [Bacteroidales bacterium]
MKKTLLTLAAIAATVGLQAANQPQTNHRFVQPLDAPQSVTFGQGLSRADDVLDVTCTEGQLWYMGDLLYDGTGFYYLIISNAGISEGGAPTGPGEIARILINAEQPDGSGDIQVPTGVYTPSAYYEGIGTFDTWNTDVIEAFYNPDDPDSGDLVGYFYDITEGSLEVSANEDGTFSVNFDVEGVVQDDDTVYFTKHITMTYDGAITVLDFEEDPSQYTPIEGDYQLDVPNASGRFVNDGFSITFYGCPLDDNGFIVGAGDLLNVEFYTQPVGDPDYSIAGTYEYFDLAGYMDGSNIEDYGPWDLMGGVWYEFYGFYMPIGTYVAIYDADGYEEAYGLAYKGSSITVTDLGQGDYRFDFDIYTVQDAHITGSWQGQIADYVLDCPVLSGIVSAVNADDSPAEYYDLQGIRIANPTAGQLLIKRQGAKSTKIRF